MFDKRGLTGRERMIRVMKREPVPGLVPHFEMVFFLTMEKIGKVHPEHRSYHQWNQMSARERRLHLEDMADCFIRIAQIFGHDAIFLHDNPPNRYVAEDLLKIIRDKTGDEFFLMMHGDPTFGVPDGDTMMEFSIQMYEEPEKLHEKAKRNLEGSLNFARYMEGKGLLDSYALCSDYAFNVNPFFSPDQFAEFIFPYLRDVITEYHKMGYWVMKHSDGNINPILDQIVEAGPDALQSVDPQGFMSLLEVRAKYGHRIATIGNVNCGLMQTGTDEEVDAEIRRCLHEGMDDGKYGFCFSTSNCIYTGFPLERYERMVELWRREGVYECRKKGAHSAP